MPEIFAEHKSGLSKKQWVFFSLIIATYVALNLYAIFNNIYYFTLLPVVLYVVYLYLFSFEKIYLAIAILVPLSISLESFDFNLALFLPTEPLLFGLLCLWLLRSIYKPIHWPGLNRNLITVAIALYFVWMIFATLLSRIPLVSWKYVVAHAWLIIPTYFLGVQIFYKKPKLVNVFFIGMLVSVIIVVIYTSIHHYMYNFSDRAGHWVMQPFYKDHAIYGSGVAMMIPTVFFWMMSKRFNRTQQFFLLLSLVILMTGLLLSYSRAAWVGFFIAVVLGIIIKFRIKFKYLALAGASLLLIGLLFLDTIINRLEKNKQDSSKDIAEHVESISNISTDASNLERINRWSCALRITADYPVTGTGPGTFQFVYGPYQLSKNLTIISTNAGTLGNAHSEFLGTMSESGIPGMLTFIFLVFAVFFYGFWTYSRWISINPDTANTILGLLLGLVTYFVHAFLNNFLDTDKIAFPVWSFVAVIVAYGIRLQDKNCNIKA